jgi:hypothetical protein
MLVYIEYRSRKPNVDLATFHKIVGRRQATWSDSWGDDRLILNIGRTWRLGPEPEYMTIYHTPSAGLERLRDWDVIFRSGDAVALEAQTRAVCRLDFASCHRPLVEPIPAQGGPYYAELFELAPGATRDEAAAHFAARRETHPDFTLHLASVRIGRLGLEPQGIAVWAIGGLERLEEIAEELDNVEHPIRLLNAALYEDVGEEIL